MLQHLRGVLLLGCRQPWRLALQRLCSTTASPSDKRRELLYSGLEDDDEADGDDDVDASSVLQEETMDVDGVKLDDETVQYMLDSIGQASDEDKDQIQRLASESFNEADLDENDDITKKESFNAFRKGVEDYVLTMVDKTAQDMMKYLIELYEENRPEFQPSNNPDFQEFPAYDIIMDACEDERMAEEVAGRFKVWVAQREAVPALPPGSSPKSLPSSSARNE
ncbi:EF-hand domain-containing protein [Plasmodiophora brassicae]|uniref:Uncharacterized protein n=1 Tax=Plasmodiophora brassicae TaxID=37360 RepID=A0A0G4IJG9_PLABS|nr:hypothetical protein PBRA_003991 [Plasmodiophora brassicae]